MSMKRLALWLLLLAGCVAENGRAAALGGDDSESVKHRHWMGRVEVASYNSLDWSVEGGVDYYPIQYAGVGVSLCAAGDFGGTGQSVAQGGFTYITKNLNDELWLRCSLQLQSPALWRNADGSTRLTIKEDCGFTLPLPANKNVEFTVLPSKPGVYENPEVGYAKNSGGKSAFIHFKTSVALQLSRWQLWAGYTWSNLDAYSSVRKVRIAGTSLQLPAKRQMSGVHLGVGYRF